MTEERKKVWDELVPGDKIWVAAPVFDNGTVCSNFQECSVIQSKEVVNRFDGKLSFWYIKFKYTNGNRKRKRGHLSIGVPLYGTDNVCKLRSSSCHDSNEISFGDVIVSLSFNKLRETYNRMIDDTLKKNEMEIAKLQQYSEQLKTGYII